MLYRLSIMLILVCFARPAYSDLVHHYTFDDEDATDNVGDLDGTVEGAPTYVDGVTGGAADRAINLNEFGGSTESILFDFTEFGEQFSLTAWVKPSDELEQDAFAMTLAASGNGGFTQPGFRWFVNTWNADPPNGRIILEAADGVEGGAVATEEFVLEQDNEWHHVAITFDKELLEVAMYHQGDLITLGLLHDFPDDQTWRIGSFANPQNAWIGAIDDFAVFDHVLDEDEVLDIFENGLGGGGIPGDYNGDGELNALDIDLQAVEMKKPAAEQDLAKFDHNNDGVVNVGVAGSNESNWGDRLIWIRNLRGTSVGDVNLDNVFDSGDLVLALQGSKYAVDAGNAQMATWVEGDWNGDMVFDSGDLVFAFQDGQYVAASAPSVPEPASILMLIAGWIGIAIRHRRAVA
jgi:hypothetical protein